MHLEPDRQAMRGGAGKSGLGAEFGEAARLLGDYLEHGYCLVENPDTAMLSHVSILWSRYLGCPASGKSVNHQWLTHLLRRCGTRTWYGGAAARNRTCSTSTCTSCTKSPARKHSTGCDWPVARCAGRI